jgi:hypothetical protein
METNRVFTLYRKKYVPLVEAGEIEGTFIRSNMKKVVWTIVFLNLKVFIKYPDTNLSTFPRTFIILM